MRIQSDLLKYSPVCQVCTSSCIYGVKFLLQGKVINSFLSQDTLTTSINKSLVEHGECISECCEGSCQTNYFKWAIYPYVMFHFFLNRKNFCIDLCIKGWMWMSFYISMSTSLSKYIHICMYERHFQEQALSMWLKYHHH